MLERQDGALTPIGREDRHPRRAAFDAATETNTARECYSLRPSVKWMSGARIDHRRRAPASSRPHHPLANTPAATVKRTAAPKQAVTKS